MFEKIHYQTYIKAFIRVNHAGEYGANRIYAGQIAFIKDKITKNEILHMQNQESKHLKYFEQQIVKYDVRPSILLPLWHVGGYALGATTALMGKSIAMLCTEAIEEVIVGHYDKQLQYLDRHKNISNQNLYDNIANFRDEELEHKIVAENNIDQTIFDKPISLLISNICKVAIFLSKKF